MGAQDKACYPYDGDRYHDIDGAKANGLKSAGVFGDTDRKMNCKNAGADYSWTVRTFRNFGSVLS